MTYSKNYLNDNPACKETNLQFDISGADLDPAEVTEILQLQPSKAFFKGEAFQTHSGFHERTAGLWSFNTRGLSNSTSTEMHAKCLLEKIEQRLAFLEKFLKRGDYNLSISVWWEGKDYHGGFTLSSETLQRLSQICNDISFFFISSESEE